MFLSVKLLIVYHNHTIILNIFFVLYISFGLTKVSNIQIVWGLNLHTNIIIFLNTMYEHKNNLNILYKQKHYIFSFQKVCLHYKNVYLFLDSIRYIIRL